MKAIRRGAGLVLSVAIWSVAASAAHAQGITNPAKNPFPVTVTIDGQTYSDGRDTLPGYDDELCTPIPNVQYDFGENQILYYNGDGELLKTARWTEWSRISSYQTWLDQQNAPTPTPTATATPAPTSTAPTGTAETNTAPTSSAPTGTSTSPTTKSPSAKTRSTKSPKTKSPSTKNASSKSPTTKSPSTSPAGNSASPKTQGGSSSTSTSTSTPTSSSPTAQGDTSSGSSPASSPATDTAATTAPAADGAPSDAAITTAVSDPGAAPVSGAAPEPGAADASAVASPEATTKFKLASSRAGVVGETGDTRLAGAGILAALVAGGFFCLLFGELRLQRFGRRRH